MTIKEILEKNSALEREWIETKNETLDEISKLYEKTRVFRLDSTIDIEDDTLDVLETVENMFKKLVELRREAEVFNNMNFEAVE